MELADVTDSKSVGSNTVWVRVPPPAPNTEAPVGCLCVWLSRTGLEAGEKNGPVERFARPGSESSPGAQHGVQAKDDLSGESLHWEQPGFYRVSCIARSCGYPSKSGTLMGEEEQRSD